MPMRTDDPMRRAELAKIHIAKKQLCLDDGVYRAIIARVVGKMRSINEAIPDSAALLTKTERHALLKEFKQLGFKPRAARAAGTDHLADSPQARKIRAEWLELRNLGVLHNSSERSLRHFARGVVGVDALDWLTPEQANAVIEGLKKWVARERAKTIEGSAS